MFLLFSCYMAKIIVRLLIWLAFSKHFDHNLIRWVPGNLHRRVSARRKNPKERDLTHASHKSIFEDDLRCDTDDSSRCASLAPSPQFFARRWNLMWREMTSLLRMKWRIDAWSKGSTSKNISHRDMTTSSPPRCTGSNGCSILDLSKHQMKHFWTRH